jgi:hypothetical protein
MSSTVRASLSVSVFLDNMTNLHVPSDFFSFNFVYYQRFQGFKYLFYYLLQQHRTKMARGIRLDF